MHHFLDLRETALLILTDSLLIVKDRGQTSALRLPALSEVLTWPQCVTDTQPGFSSSGIVFLLLPVHCGVTHTAAAPPIKVSNLIFNIGHTCSAISFVTLKGSMEHNIFNAY